MAKTASSYLALLTGSVAIRALIVLALVEGTSAMSVIDLTHTINEDSIVWPGIPSFTFTQLFRGLTDDGYWFESNSFSTAEHMGTHLDSPAHFAKGHWRTEEIPASRLVGPGVVVDVTAKAEADPDYRLSVKDLEDWEETYRTIPDGAFVFMLSGWASRYPDKNMTFNTNNTTDFHTFHFPGFHPDAVDWLLAERSISMIGVDTPSTDYGQSTTFDVHQKLGAANRMGIENVNNLDKVPASGSIIVVGVAKIFDGSGGPVRLLALIDIDSCGNAATPMRVGSLSSLVLLSLVISVLYSFLS